MTEYTLQAVIQKAIDSFEPEKAAGIDAQIQLHLTGDQGGDWSVTIRDQKLSVVQEDIPNPDLMLTADTKDVLDLVGGKLNPMQAFMRGKVKFKGDISLAMRLLEVFKRPESWQ